LETKFLAQEDAFRKLKDFHEELVKELRERDYQIKERDN
jgi:hypothetical protein